MTRRVAVIGAGTIGASWAAIFLARGFEVAATDPAAGAEDFARHFINNAWPTLQKLGLVVPGASAQRMSFHRGVAAAVNGAEFVQESGPEREDLKIELFAAEPLLANPVAFCFDEKGRCYVAETFRIQHGVTDNRGHMDWLDDDLASRTVEDRIALYRKYAKDRFHNDYEIEHERVRLIEDSKGEGVADRATVFADGFHHAADGIGAGVLARKGNVYYTCIPDLWLLRDTKGEGRADVKQSLATGFGVHVAFLGHDMHGLRFGPDSGGGLHLLALRA